MIPIVLQPQVKPSLFPAQIVVGDVTAGNAFLAMLTTIPVAADGADSDEMIMADGVVLPPLMIPAVSTNDSATQKTIPASAPLVGSMGDNDMVAMPISARAYALPTKHEGGNEAEFTALVLPQGAPDVTGHSLLVPRNPGKPDVIERVIVPDPVESMGALPRAAAQIPVSDKNSAREDVVVDPPTSLAVADVMLMTPPSAALPRSLAAMLSLSDLAPETQRPPTHDRVAIPPALVVPFGSPTLAFDTINMPTLLATQDAVPHDNHQQRHLKAELLPILDNAPSTDLSMNAPVLSDAALLLAEQTQPLRQVADSLPEPADFTLLPLQPMPQTRGLAPFVVVAPAQLGPQHTIDAAAAGQPAMSGEQQVVALPSRATLKHVLTRSLPAGLPTVISPAERAFVTRLNRDSEFKSVVEPTATSKPVSHETTPPKHTDAVEQPLVATEPSAPHIAEHPSQDGANANLVVTHNPSAAVFVQPATPAQQSIRLTEMIPVSAFPETVARIAKTDSGDAVTLRLDPVELGPIHLTMQGNDTALSVVVKVDNPDTLDLLRRHADQFLADLRQSGFSNATLSFDLSNQTASQQRQHNQQQDMPRQNPPPPALQARDALADTPPPPPQRRGRGLDLRL